MRVFVLALALSLVPTAARGQAPAFDRFLKAFHPELLPDGGASLPEPALCATGLVEELRDAPLTAGQQELVRTTLDPFHRARVAGLDGGRETCLTPASVDFGPYTELEETEHFAIHWNLDGRTSPFAIIEVAGRLEAAWDILIDEQGWPRPPGMDELQMLVVVQWMESNVFAWVSSASCPGRGYLPYMVVNARYFTDLDQVRSTIGHEIFHGIQMRYAWPGFQDLDQNRWWKEATATYQQGLVYPDDPEPVLDHLLDWTRAPWRTIETYGDSLHQYGAAVLLLSIEGELGDWTWHRRFWDHLAETEAEDIPEALTEFLPDEGLSFAEAWRAHLARGGAADYPRYPDAPAPHELKDAIAGWVDNGTVADHTAGDYPTERTVALDHDPPGPESLGANYAWFGTAGVEEGRGLALRFFGAPGVGGVDADWVVEYLAIRDGGIAERASAELGWDPEERDGEGAWVADLQLENASEYDGAVLGVSPTGEFEGRAEWGYRARAWPGGGGAGWVEPAGEGDGCAGCSAAGKGSGAWALLLVLFGVRRRTGAPGRR